MPVERTWDQWFAIIAPRMIDEAGQAELRTALGTSYRQKIYPDDFSTLIVQLRALGYIKKSVRNRSVKDSETYWTLTPRGERRMVELRAIRRDKSCVV